MIDNSEKSAIIVTFGEIYSILTKHLFFVDTESEVSTPRSFSEEASSEDAVRVTRSIMIVKPPGSQNRDSPPVSPAGTTPPVSPFAGKLTLLF